MCPSGWSLADSERYRKRGKKWKRERKRLLDVGVDDAPGRIRSSVPQGLGIKALSSFSVVNE